MKDQTMKVSAEIKDGEFHYSYKVGENTHNATSPMNADHLIIFADLVRLAHKAFGYGNEKSRREIELEISGKTWIEENKEKAQDFIKTGKR